MTDDPLFQARVHMLLTDAVARLDPTDRAERIAHCQAHDQHGVRMHTSDDDSLLEFVWGGRRLCLIDRDALLDDGPILQTEFVADIPDTLPDEWSDQ